MSNNQQYGKWTVEETLKSNRCFLATSEDQKGVVKIGSHVDREVDNLKKLNHPNIVDLIDHDLEAKTPYLVTEYHSFGSLTKGTLSQFTIDEKIQMCRAISEAVTHCHSKGIKRGCYNLANVVITEDKQAVLIDLEYQKILNEERDIKLEKHNLARLIWKIGGREWVMKQMLQQKAELLN